MRTNLVRHDVNTSTNIKILILTELMLKIDCIENLFDEKLVRGVVYI